MGLRAKLDNAVAAASTESASSEAGASASAAEGGSSQGEGTAQGTSGSESTEGTPSPGDSGAAATEGESDASTEGAAGDGEGEGDKTKVPAYKPREKFKVMDAEHEVPAFLKGLMKDEASEKQVIELLEKSFGLEPVKTRLAETRKERDTIKVEFGKMSSTIDDVRKTYQRGDIDAFLEKLAIPQERMLQWALDKVNYSQLPPEQQRVLDERRDAQRKAWSAEQQNAEMGNQFYEERRQAKSMLLEAGLARPEVSAFQQAFDARVGKPGAFVQEIVEAGASAWNQSQGKEDLSPQQAIERVMSKWRPFIETAAPAVSTQPAAGAPASGQGTQAAPQAKPSIIPNLQGRQQSPMKPKARNLEDLKKLRDQAIAENR